MQPLPEPTPQAPISFGRYKLMRRIGAGGMGEVFLAREESGPTPRACVVKKVLPNLSENRAFVGRFLDESKVVVRLNPSGAAGHGGVKPWELLRSLGGRLLAEPGESVLRDEDFEALR